MLEFKTVTGNHLEKYLGDVAALRISVFAQYPYLYEGDVEYEKKYLSRYALSGNACVILAFDGAKVVGASTGNALVNEMDEIKQPLISAGYKPEEVFYFAESVLLPEYRGQGAGKMFMHKRQEFAATDSKVKTLAFCAVERGGVKAPEGYKSPQKLWQNFGFVKYPELVAYMKWKDIGAKHETPKPLTFWLKQL